MSSIATTCAVHIEDSEGWWLSGDHRVVVEHWQLKLQDARTLGFIYVDCWLLTSLPFHFVTSKHFFNCANYKCLASMQLSHMQQHCMMLGRIVCKCPLSKHHTGMWWYISSTVARKSRCGQCLQSLAQVQGVKKVQDQAELLIRQNCCLILLVIIKDLFCRYM